MPAALVPLAITNHFRGFCVIVIPWVIVISSSFGVGSSDKPRLHKWRSGEVLLVGNGLGDERFQIKLLAMRFQFLPVLVPGPPTAPILFPIKQSDDRHRPGQHNQDAANASPT